MSENVPPLPATGAPKKKRANGCLIAFVVAVVVGLLTFAIGGYYMMMHSALPLRSVASIINAGKEARIDGLDGTLATGFHFDEFRIFKTGSGDSYIRDFRFRFNGMPDVSGSARLIINELHIGRIFLSLPEKPGGADEAAELKTEFSRELENQKDAELQRFELQSFTIDEVVIQDAAGERQVGSLQMEGLVAAGDDVSLKSFDLTSDHIDGRLVATDGTNRFRQAVRGTIRTTLHTNFLKDLDFAVNFGGPTNGGAVRIDLFGGQLVMLSERDGTSVAQFRDFSPAEWLGGFKEGTPTHMSFSVTGNRSGKRSKVAAGILVLGQVRYEVPEQELDHVSFGGARLTAMSEIAGVKITAKIAHPESGQGFRYEFAAADLAGDDLLSHALIGKPLDQLTDAERRLLDPFRPPAP